jgi:hypothetical protein
MYCIVECRLGVAINPKHKIKDHKIFYVIDKREIIESWNSTLLLFHDSIVLLGLNMLRRDL